MKRRNFALLVFLPLFLFLSCSKTRKNGELLVAGSDWDVVSYVIGGTEFLQPGSWTSATISFYTVELPPGPSGTYEVIFHHSNGNNGYIFADYEVTDKGKTLTIDYSNGNGTDVVVYDLFVDDQNLELIDEATHTDIVAKRK